jgi:hypothetical protein
MMAQSSAAAQSTSRPGSEGRPVAPSHPARRALTCARPD